MIIIIIGIVFGSSIISYKQIPKLVQEDGTFIYDQYGILNKIKKLLWEAV